MYFKNLVSMKKMCTSFLKSILCIKTDSIQFSFYVVIVSSPLSRVGVWQEGQQETRILIKGKSTLIINGRKKMCCGEKRFTLDKFIL